MSVHRLVAAGVAAMTVALGMLVGPTESPASAAGARTATGQAPFACGLRYEGQPDSAQKYEDPVTLQLQLQVPDSVAAGQTISLRGTLAIQMSAYLSESSKGYYDTFEGYTDTFSIGVTIGGRTTVVRADRWQSPRTAHANPLVVRAPITFPGFRVPAGSTGAVRVSLPRNNLVPNTAYDSPAKVAFTARARAVGSFGDYKYDMGCYQPKETEGRVADIPITAAAAPASSGSSGSSASTSISTNDDDDNSPSSDSSSSGANSAPLVSHSPGSVAADSGVAVPASAPMAERQLAGAETSAPSSGVYVSGSTLVFIGALICALAIGYAAWMHRRIGGLEESLDD